MLNEDRGFSSYRNSHQNASTCWDLVQIGSAHGDYHHARKQGSLPRVNVQPHRLMVNRQRIHNRRNNMRHYSSVEMSPVHFSRSSQRPGEVGMRTCLKTCKVQFLEPLQTQEVFQACYSLRGEDCANKSSESSEQMDSA